MDPTSRELLTGMGNCYEACHADFEGTIGMVGDARDLSRTEVLARLHRIREQFGNEEEFRRLRARFPIEFPV